LPAQLCVLGLEARYVEVLAILAGAQVTESAGDGFTVFGFALDGSMLVRSVATM